LGSLSSLRKKRERGLDEVRGVVGERPFVALDRLGGTERPMRTSRRRWIRGAKHDANGDEPQVVVPGGSFKAVRLEEGFEFGIIGEGVAPGFDFRDFKFVTEEELKGRSAEAHAAAADLVKKEPEDVKFQSFYED